MIRRAITMRTAADNQQGVSHDRWTYRPCRRRAFTLLELMVVLVILTLLASGSLLLINDGEELASEQISQVEMLEIKKAMLRFKRDTGFLPNQGPFNLETRPAGFVPLANIPAYVPAGQRVAWFDSPANFWQLFVNPLDGTGHRLERFNPMTGRGWHGPYLNRFGEGLVDVGDNLQTDGSGDPTLGSVLPSVFGVADPRFSDPVGLYLVWRTAASDPPRRRWGRPYFVFDLDQKELARIVGSGTNRTYDGGTGDDLVMELYR